MAFKMIVYIFVSVAAVFSVIFLYNYYISEKIVEKNLKLNAENLTKKGVAQIENKLIAIQKIPDNYSKIFEKSDFSKESIINVIKQEVELNPEIFGAAIAFEPYFFDKEEKHYMAYYYRKGDGYELKFPQGDVYDYFTMDWYQIPKELNKPDWSEPYYEDMSEFTIMSTYSVPLYRNINGEKQLIGIMTADVSLDWLQTIVNAIKIYETGYGYMISKNGTIVTHPIRDLIMNETVFSIAEAQGSNQLREIGRHMIRGEESFAEMEYSNLKTGKKSWISYAPVTLNGWSLGIVFPVDELMSDVNSLFSKILFLGLIGLFIILIVIILISRSITSPLRGLTNASIKIAEGNFGVKIPEIKTKDEMKDLHDSFVYMQTKLAEYIENLKETTSAREKIESELRIAREIQMGMIPKIFPPFPNLPEIDLYATLQPAKEVGGDLYDFFLIDDKHLCFAIGDVSGKGVPASLFMAVTRTLLRSVAPNQKSPAVIVNILNKSLSTDNESNMFVTFFLGILNVDTGEMKYTNAGHNPPLLVKPDGNTEYFGLTTEIPVGLFENYEYGEKICTISTNDKLFLYTDGVTEAEDQNEVLYSDKKLLDCVSENYQSEPRDLIGRVAVDIASHVRGNAQSDDLTMLCIVYKDK